MSDMPTDLEEAVARAVFEDMDRLGWAGLPHGKRTEQYARWLRTPAIGGRLTDFMAEERARVWIKDGPVKEWRRAKAGTGRYAGMVTGAISAESIVAAALGSDWSLIEGSLASKPLRIRVFHARSEEEKILTWGPSRDLKHLIWAAIKADATGEPTPWHLVVVGTFTHPTPADQQEFNARIARRVGLPIAHIEVG